MGKKESQITALISNLLLLKKAGCDLILGSDAKEDKCRVCNGGGNNCRTIQNIYTGYGIGIVLCNQEKQKQI